MNVIEKIVNLARGGKSLTAEQRATSLTPIAAPMPRPAEEDGAGAPEKRKIAGAIDWPFYDGTLRPIPRELIAIAIRRSKIAPLQEPDIERLKQLQADYERIQAVILNHTYETARREA